MDIIYENKESYGHILNKMPKYDIIKTKIIIFFCKRM